MHKSSSIKSPGKSIALWTPGSQQSINSSEMFGGKHSLAWLADAQCLCLHGRLPAKHGQPSRPASAACAFCKRRVACQVLTLLSALSVGLVVAPSATLALGRRCLRDGAAAHGIAPITVLCSAWPACMY